MSLSSALKAGLGARLKDLSGTGAGADWDPYPEEARDKAAAEAKVPSKAAGKTSAAKTGAVQPLRADRQNAVAPVARTPRPANANSEEPSAPAPKAPRARREAAGAPWLQGKAAGLRVNPQQYARELDRYMTEQNRQLTQETVMEVGAGELEGVAQMAAKARGRYFAKLLDAGAPRHGFLQEAEIAELRFYREMYEEMTQGFEAMRDAIEAGDISVTGMKKR
ncbi:MAG: hypothetical protein JJ959_17885 [Nisaea sp.]|uniref:hypothetical protein n=1 Tax=Nisaea sp. TaxID=2024842 RepID=UPI001B1B672F|nr:hypothetical protein [Nisaea sp.]MBO6562422.1 hypothetical protein [Nisaea sp.]